MANKDMTMATSWFGWPAFVALLTACSGGHDDSPGDGDADADADGDGDGDGDADADGDADGDGDGDADCVAEVTDCGGTDELEVLVVDDVPGSAEGVPQGGVEVVVTCAAGRMRATTGPDGRAVFTGLSFEDDPPDVSAIDEETGGDLERAVYTRVALGFGGRAVPRPYVIALDADWPVDDPPAIPVELEPATGGTEHTCWSRGARGYARRSVGQGDGHDEKVFLGPDATIYDAVVRPELTPSRVSCLELDQAELPRTLLAFGEVDVAHDASSATLVLEPAEWERFSFTLDDSAPIWAEGRRELHVWVDDEGEDFRANPVGMHETSELGEAGLDTIGVGWIPDRVQGTARLRVNLYAYENDFRFPYESWSGLVKMEDLAQEQHFVAHPPPTYTFEGEGADRVLRLHGAEDWADDYLVLLGPDYYYWVPAGWDSVRIGHMPDCAPPPTGTLYTGAYRYDEPLPEQDHWFGRWWVEHLVEAARRNDFIQ